MHWYTYPTRISQNAIGPAVVAILAPAFPLGAVALLRIALGKPVDIDLSRLSLEVVLIGLAAWGFLAIACVPRGYTYAQRYRIDKNGIVRRVLGVERLFEWHDIAEVEKRLEPEYGFRGWFDHERIVIRGSKKAFVVHDGLTGYDDFKIRLSDDCLSRSIPQTFVDASSATLSRLKTEDTAQYQLIRKSGIRTRVQRL